MGDPSGDRDGEAGRAEAAASSQMDEPILLLPGLGGPSSKPGREQHGRDGVVGQEVMGQRREQGDRVVLGGAPFLGAPPPVLAVESEVEDSADDPE